MECPLDGITLETHTKHTVDVEECPQCKGIWFEKGELSKAKDDAEPDLNWLDFDLWSDHDSFNADWSARNCPICGEKMATISYADTGIKIDYCTEGHGVWLDKGEFEAIIDALEKESLSMDSSDYARASLKEAKDLAVGGEGFASEWNDFHSVTRLLQYRILAENPRVAELLLALQTSTPFK
jgi:Zn-finger nucleic acid-binding protein